MSAIEVSTDDVFTTPEGITFICAPLTILEGAIFPGDPDGRINRLEYWTERLELIGATWVYEVHNLSEQEAYIGCTCRLSSRLWEHWFAWKLGRGTWTVNAWLYPSRQIAMTIEARKIHFSGLPLVNCHHARG